MQPVDAERAQYFVATLGDILELTTILAGDGVARIKVRYKRPVEMPEAASSQPNALVMPSTADLEAQYAE